MAPSSRERPRGDHCAGLELAATWTDKGGGGDVGSSRVDVVSGEITSLGGGRFGFICSLSESFRIFDIFDELVLISMYLIIASVSSDVHTTKK